MDRHRWVVRLGVCATAAFVWLAIGCNDPATQGNNPPADGATATTTADERSAPTGGATGRRIRVGGWNIEWLGTPGSRSGPAKNVEQTADDIADYILASGVNVLTLQEIASNEGDDAWTNSTLTRAFQIINVRTGAKWTHKLAPATTGRNQQCGIAWDAAVVTPVGEMKPAASKGPQVDGATVWSRPPPGLMFSAGSGLTDFVVISIHMKSNFGGDFANVRGEEARRLARSAPLTFSDGDLLIIGDSNCAKHAEPGPQALIEAGWADLNDGDQPTFWQGSGALDRAFVPKNQPEFAERRFEVFRDAYLKQKSLNVREFKQRFSDHFMVITEVLVMRDDD
ncbi:MAG: hypothetical protein HRU75_04160 [Planctomycetia bacterium]|nr:MAG: hypothetical protein HRU75_04160 [Planctomycetia bacterium]